MQNSLRMGLIVTGLAIAGTVITGVKPASALVVHDGWNYSMDAINDSSPFKSDGTGLFEIYGTAYKVDNGVVTFAINSNVDLATGVNDSRASGGKIHYGDLLLNFTGKSLEAANNELFGIRFDANNESGVSALGVGVYSNVTAKQVATANASWGSLGQYNQYILGKGVKPTIGDLVYDDTYFDQNKEVLNVIESGTKVGNINFISDLSTIGLDFAHFNSGKTGSKTFAFSFDAAFLPTDSTGIYHFGFECNNDLVAGSYFSPTVPPTDVPTPAAVLPAVFGMIGAAFRKKEEQDVA